MLHCGRLPGAPVLRVRPHRLRPERRTTSSRARRREVRDASTRCAHNGAGVPRAASAALRRHRRAAQPASEADAAGAADRAADAARRRAGQSGDRPGWRPSATSSRYFTHLLGTAFAARSSRSSTFGATGTTTVRYFPDKLPIGLDADGRTHVFVYLVTRPRRSTSGRSSSATPSCSGACRVDDPPAGSAALVRGAARLSRRRAQELATPLRPSIARGAALVLRAAARLGGGAPQVPGRDARAIDRRARAFAAPRFRALYRAWLREGAERARCGRVAGARGRDRRGTGTVECHVLAARPISISLPWSARPEGRAERGTHRGSSPSGVSPRSQ